uniref:(northern house mosquito) hypothetical protein n=1 Tax=Culex pipiens TaxID=7175 RepID=A0A8D8B1W1_CULPI
MNHYSWTVPVGRPAVARRGPSQCPPRSPAPGRPPRPRHPCRTVQGQSHRWWGVVHRGTRAASSTARSTSRPIRATRFSAIPIRRWTARARTAWCHCTITNRPVT